MAGNAEPFKGDPTVYNAIKAGHEALLKGAATIKALTADQTRNEPQKHEAGGEVSAKNVAKLEETQRILQAQANAYQAGGDAALKEAFAINDGDKWLSDHWLSYVGREAKNQDGGFANIRKAATTHRELAAVIMKMLDWVNRLFEGSGPKTARLRDPAAQRQFGRTQNMKRQQEAAAQRAAVLTEQKRMLADADRFREQLRARFSARTDWIAAGANMMLGVEQGINSRVSRAGRPPPGAIYPKVLPSSVISGHALAVIRHKSFGCRSPLKPQNSNVFWTRTFFSEVRVKRDKSRSETDFGVSGSLRGSVATGKTARKLGILHPL